MPSRKRLYRRVGPVVLIGLVLAGIVGAVGYGVAQSTVVTQAEWAVYMVRALEMDWNLPPNPKSNHYIARLDWGASLEFAATALQEGSSPAVEVSSIDAGYVRAAGPGAEALYRVGTPRPGEYGFRVKLAGGGAVVKVGTAVFEAFQPEDRFRWVELSRVSLDPGPHTVSLFLTEGARAEMLGVVPPCLVSIEPGGGWAPLKPLNYEDLAVTVARALELEVGLPPLDPKIVLKGEQFTRTMEIPLGESALEPPDPFWLASGNAVLSARAAISVPESGLYTLEARYISPIGVRWIVDGCLRAITCPVEATSGLQWTRVVALDLEAGEHTIEVTLPPGASLDQLVIQHRDGAPREYLGIVADEGFNMGPAHEGVSRRQAVSAALRLRGLFERWRASLCPDALTALERAAALALASSRGASAGGVPIPGSSTLQDVTPGFPDDKEKSPIFPTEGPEPPVASPVNPGG